MLSSKEESKKVSYFTDKSFGSYYYGPNHLMKPYRVRITDSLVNSYGLLEKMNIINPSYYEDIVKTVDFTKFHSDEYVDFLKNVTPENSKFLTKQLMYFNINEDCPIFENIYDFCKVYTTGSILGAHLINKNISNIAINWSGGLHHAKKHEASGFCYINDCVLAILELLQHHDRVLYIDIDVHHGDGVEEAFYTTDRVLTLSFHKYGDYFPGTGGLHDIGYKKGKYHSVNVPYHEGMDDIYSFLVPPLKLAVGGRVYDTDTKENLEGATVELFGSDGTSLSVQTLADGMYRYELKPNVKYKISASFTGSSSMLEII